MKLILGAALAAAIATPAAAQMVGFPTVSPPSSEALNQRPAMESRAAVVKQPRSAAGAYAQAPGMQRQRAGTTDVYVNGVYVGSDPDPRIRSTLRREFLDE
jgi:hypothetical protein